MSYLRLLAINSAPLALLLIAAEAVAGYASVVRSCWTVPDIYGPGIVLKTNGQGFRCDLAAP